MSEIIKIEVDGTSVLPDQGQALVDGETATRIQIVQQEVSELEPGSTITTVEIAPLPEQQHVEEPVPQPVEQPVEQPQPPQLPEEPEEEAEMELTEEDVLLGGHREVTDLDEIAEVTEEMMKNAREVNEEQEEKSQGEMEVTKKEVIEEGEEEQEQLEEVKPKGRPGRKKRKANDKAETEVSALESLNNVFRLN